MRAKITIKTLCLSLIISGCASYEPKPDLRTYDQKFADLKAVRQELAGNYTVKESVNDDFDRQSLSTDFAFVSVSGTTLHVKLAGKSKTLEISGIDCDPWLSKPENYPSLYCKANPDGMVFGLNIHRSTSDEVVERPAIFGSGVPMKIKAGDYVLRYYEHRGRSHHYIINKIAK